MARIGVCGGGVGGLTVAVALQQSGHEVTVHEQADRYGRIGSDVNLTPNAVHALDGLGVGAKLRETAARPTYRISRTWDTGEVTSRLVMSDAAERRYGAPQLTIHRADLLSVLESRLRPGTIRHGRRATAFSRTGSGVSLLFDDGAAAEFEALIGADGIHSVVRTQLFGPDDPEFTGLVSYRTVVDRAGLDVPNLDAFTKWWGPVPETQIITFPLNRGRETFVFATAPQAEWTEESWTSPGDVEEVRAVYADFHPEARALLDACRTVTKSALYVRQPMPRWSSGNVTLLGDACHPMVPFMAQGACMAIEDGVVLARLLDGVAAAGVPAAFERYEGARRSRTARVQIGSRGNEWLREGGNADWVYAYNAWETPLEDNPAAGIGFDEQ